MTETKNEERILFPEVKVANFIVKPWSFGILFDIADMLGLLIDKAEKKGIIEDLESLNGVLKYTTIAKLFSIANKEILIILCKTLDVEEKEITSLSMDDGIKLVMVVYNQNKSTIINSLKNALSVPPKDQDLKEEK